MVYSRIINASKLNLGASHNIKTKAKELRKNMTETEKILWDHLRKRKQKGFYFRRQHPYNIYILDFYSLKANIAIEIDGKIHLGRKEYEADRTRFLESSGLKVLRFRNEDIESRIDWVIEAINRFLSNKLPPSQHFPLGGNGKGGKK